jgi:hypothetical protein
MAHKPRRGAGGLDVDRRAETPAHSAAVGCRAGNDRAPGARPRREHTPSRPMVSVPACTRRSIDFADAREYDQPLGLAQFRPSNRRPPARARVFRAILGIDRKRRSERPRSALLSARRFPLGHDLGEKNENNWASDCSAATRIWYKAIRGGVAMGAGASDRLHRQATRCRLEVVRRSPTQTVVMPTMEENLRSAGHWATTVKVAIRCARTKA